jgi:hypothetical protein
MAKSLTITVIAVLHLWDWMKGIRAPHKMIKEDVDWMHLVQESYEHSNEPSGSIKGRELLDLLSSLHGVS